MGQGANITVCNFSSHILDVDVEQHDYVSGTEALDTTLQPSTGLMPVYIEGTGITSNSYVTLKLTVMKEDAAGKYVPDDRYTKSYARVQLTGSHWSAGDQTNGAIAVDLGVKDFKQDVLTLFLANAS